MRVLIEAQTTPALWKEGGSTATLRVEVLKGFTTALGQDVPPSNGNKFYLEIPLTITAQELLIPGFELDSTLDCFPWDSDVVGDVPGYRFSIVTSEHKIIPYFSACRVPALADGDPSITWTELRLLNRARKRQVIPQRFLPESTFLGLVQAAVGDLNRSSSTNTGVTALTVDPLDPIFPIAIGANDPTFNALRSSFTFLSAYDSPADAVIQIGATPTTLIINSLSPIGADLTFAPTTTLLFMGAGQLQPADGVTVTIQGAVSAPPVKIFDNATGGEGTILFTNNHLLGDIYPQWWGAIANDAFDCTAAIQAAIDTLDQSNLSGTIWFPSGTYRVAGVLRDTANSNAQLLLPRRTTAMLSIRLAGITPAPTIAFKRDNQGAVIKSVLAAGSGAIIGGKVGAGGWPVAGMSWCSITIENLTIRAIANPTYSGIDLTYYPNIAIRNVQISVDEDVIASLIPTFGVTEPTTATSYGLKLAPNNVPDQSIVENVEIYGFYTQMLAGELCNVDNTLLIFGKVGMEIPHALHAMRFGRVYVSDCATVLKFTGGNSYVDFQQLDIERSPASPGWAAVTTEIDDPNNYGHGVARWHVSDNGAVSQAITQVGAFYLWTESIGNISAIHSSSPMIAVFNSANLLIPNSTFTNVTFDTDESDDPFGMHSTVSNTDRLVPAKEGVVEIRFTGLFEANATGTRQVRIYKHSGVLNTEILLEVQNVMAISGVDKTVKASALSRATDPGDYFYVQVWQDSGSGLNLLSSANFTPRATMNISR